jgi:hypothetical protein
MFGFCAGFFFMRSNVRHSLRRRSTAEQPSVVHAVVWRLVRPQIEGSSQCHLFYFLSFICMALFTDFLPTLTFATERP